MGVGYEDIREAATMVLSPHSRACLFAAALGVALMATPAAQAFQLEGANGQTGAGQQNFRDWDTRMGVDPESQASEFGDGKTTIKQDDFSVHFGQERSFNQRYNSDNLFHPNGQPYWKR
jgi:hypothetical protein